MGAESLAAMMSFADASTAVRSNARMIGPGSRVSTPGSKEVRLAICEEGGNYIYFLDLRIRH